MNTSLSESLFEIFLTKDSLNYDVSQADELLKLKRKMNETFVNNLGGWCYPSLDRLFFLCEFCLGRIFYPDDFLQLKISQSLTTLVANAYFP